MKPGDYRLRFEHDGFVSLERDVAVKGGTPLALEITLSPMPAPPPKPSEPAPASTAPPGEAKALSVGEFLVPLSDKDPFKSNELGCTASARTTLLQIPTDLQKKATPVADELLYIVGGQGSLRLGDKDVQLETGGVAVVPRGTSWVLSRKGKKPLIVLSVVSGPPCTK